MKTSFCFHRMLTRLRGKWLPQRIATVFLSVVCSLSVWASEPEFWHLQTSDGLADGHVSCICRDRSGYLWFGTIAGLSRFDGYRIRNFYFSSTDTASIASNQINRVFEADGMIWVETNVGYCLYDPSTERFDRNMEGWMERHGMKGRPDLAFADSRGNLWIVVNRRGCYFYVPSTGEHHLFPMDGKAGSIPSTTVTDISERGCALLLTYDDGTMVRLDGAHRRVVWSSRALQKLCGGKYQKFTTYIDSRYNYWVLGEKRTWVYAQHSRRWFSSAEAFLRAEGYAAAPHMLIKDVKESVEGELWLATEHDGLYIASRETRTLQHVAKDDSRPNALPDHTIRSLYFDPSGGIWLATYQSGVVYTSKALTRFRTIPLGDVCTIAEDSQGRYWCGTNDRGIVCYSPESGELTRYTGREAGLYSDVVVSSLHAADGSLWFGGFNGGLTRFFRGAFHAYHQCDGLANESVWALTELKDGSIAIGTLGGGVQLFSPSNGHFTTFNSRNSALSSDYIASLAHDTKRIVAGHSLGLSFYDPSASRWTNMEHTRSGKPFSNSTCNQAFTDSRSLVWSANAAGLDIYDPKTDSLYSLHDHMRLASAVGEDSNGTVWASHADGRVSHITVTRSLGRDGCPTNQWLFSVTSFDRLDGLQPNFNYRSILADSHGNMVFGGQQGINIIPVETPKGSAAEAHALFSGLALFDHPVLTGEEFNGRIVLERSLNASRHLRLRHSENAFSILLASDRVTLPQRARFVYSLEGFADDQWLMLPDGQSAVTFTNLSPGTYTLRVKVVGRDGSTSRTASALRITILPPWWLTAWAFVLYALLLCAAAWLVWYFTVHRKLARLKLQHLRHMDEVKLKFLTDMSHELRTPLALIISPLSVMIGKETDSEHLSRLQLIYRNARRLLSLVNQSLDLRNIEEHTASLQLTTADFVVFAGNICQNFSALSQKHIDLSFTSNCPGFSMAFDADKMEKVITNLLSNAYKFTPEGGKIAVTVTYDANEPFSCGLTRRHLTLSVADTGCGISDADKAHVFDRFYQAQGASRTPFAGSGIGLNIAREFVHMHKGEIGVRDNEGGGSVFWFSMPTNLMADNEATAAEALPAVSSDTAADKAQREAMNDLLRKGDYEVLLVDDSEDFLAFMTDLLGTTYKVRTATNGREALKRIADHQPDIILCDVMMPEMDGNELCRRLKANPKTERIPFVMLTARLSSDSKLEGLTAGADDYLTKPFNLDLLNLRIYNLIKWHNATPVGEKVTPKVKEEQVTSIDEQLVSDATAVIEQNLSNSDFSVEMLCKELGMSRANLYKRLLNITGCTPSELIRNVRLRHAEQLLRKGQMNVSEVAYKVGFNNPRYFSKYFKEMFGIMPSQLKNPSGSASAAADEREG